MVKACRKASKTLIRDFGEIENLQVSVKGPGDFVTVSDKKVEKILINELQKARPDYSILSEEIGEINNNKSFKWIIDPIDGTANFLHGIPHFAISIGLESEGEILNSSSNNPKSLDRKVSGKIIKPSQEELEFHKKYLKNDLQKNYY